MPSYVAHALGAVLWAYGFLRASAQEQDDRSSHRRIMRGHQQHRHYRGQSHTHSGGSDGDYSMSIDPEGRIYDQHIGRSHHHPSEYRDTAEESLNAANVRIYAQTEKNAMCGRSQACHFFQGRYRPQLQHRTWNDLLDRSDIHFSHDSRYSPYEPLPDKFYCSVAVDDTLDGIYYNGAQIVVPTGNLCPGNAISFTFVPVPNATLTIIGHDRQPGFGLASCAGMGITCGAGGNSTGVYAQFADWTTWRVRSVNNSDFGSTTSGYWDIVGPGTSSSFSCGITPQMPITMWQSRSVYVAAQWTTPMGSTTTTTTTTTVTNVTINITLKAACSPSFSVAALFLIAFAWLFVR